MTDPTPQSLGSLLALLEGRFALRILWALRDGQPRTFRALQQSVGSITPNTLNTRIKELRKATLLTHGGNGYLLTKLGASLVQTFEELPAFAEQWSLACESALSPNI